MLQKICEYCETKFEVKDTKKSRRFCGPICSRRWAANNRSDTWRKKVSESKQGENNPMFGVKQTNPNSLSNLARGYWSGKALSDKHKQKISNKQMGRIVKEESIKKMIQTKIDKGIFWKSDDPQYAEFKKYRRKVYYWTSKNNLTILENHDKRSKLGYHLDHKYSITQGFKNNVPPKIIGSIHNLEFIPYIENVKKGVSCSITLEELYELFSAVD